MELTILGAGSGGPFQGRNYTSQVLRVDNQVFIIDCGEGMQHQLYRFKVRYDSVQQIFISHLHGDHVFGLMGLLTSFCLKKRTATLTIFGPKGLQELIETTSRLAGVRYPYTVLFEEVDTTVSKVVFENTKVSVATIPLNHRGALCTGWLFREKVKPANILAEKIAEYHIPYQAIKDIKAGGDFQLPDGSVVPHHELTTPPKAPVSYAFCSDTAPSVTVIDIVYNVTCLYHEATFTNELLEEAEISGHSTAEQAATVALNANVGRLIIGHFSGRYKDVSQHLNEARVIFPNTEAAEEGETYLV